MLVTMFNSRAALRETPFTVADAAALGLTWDDLQTTSWMRLSRGQYASSRLRHDTWLILRAVAQRMPAGYAFSGLTAAWLLGLDVSPCDPVEVTIPRDLTVRTRAGVRLRRADLPECDVVTRHSFRLTSAIRTVCELGSRADLVQSVVALDMALHAGLIDVSNLKEHTVLHAGKKGNKRLRRATGFTDGRSESPMETRLRMLLVKARLPRPCVQSELCDASGNFIGRADLYYPNRRLVIEYDGDNHRDRLLSDIRRQNALVNAGYQVLRFAAADLRNPGLVAAQVRRAHKIRALKPQPSG